MGSNLDEDMKIIEELEQCLNSENHQPQDSADLLDVSESNQKQVVIPRENKRVENKLLGNSVVI